MQQISRTKSDKEFTLGITLKTKSRGQKVCGDDGSPSFIRFPSFRIWVSLPLSLYKILCSFKNGCITWDNGNCRIKYLYLSLGALKVYSPCDMSVVFCGYF